MYVLTQSQVENYLVLRTYCRRFSLEHQSKRRLPLGFRLGRVRGTLKSTTGSSLFLFLRRSEWISPKQPNHDTMQSSPDGPTFVSIDGDQSVNGFECADAKSVRAGRLSVEGITKKVKMTELSPASGHIRVVTTAMTSTHSYYRPSIYLIP
jgi:hypothetical protein